jgi:hypothetical protein
LHYAHSDGAHPGASIDFLGINFYNHIFGFLDRQDALDWFDKSWLDRLAQFGFNLVEVEADHDSIIISRSCKQIIFKRANARTKTTP